MTDRPETTMRWPPPRRPADHETWLAEDAQELRVIERWRSEYRIGACRRVETYFEQNPQLVESPDLAIRLIYEEACLREEAGERPELAEYLQRFPQWSDQLAMLWDCHELLARSSAVPQFPAVGESLGDFQLVTELDRGAAGRVYLATQPRLSDRPVVLKITAHNGQEHLSLARLQHASIVPLYLVQDYVERNLRVMCMPYLGGNSLARILQFLDNTPIDQRRGNDLCRALDACRSPLVESLDDRGPARKLYARSSYVDAICWIGAALAEGLHHAHQRDLVHLDVKPSNVLIAGDGQPMLLDFHLAQPMLPAGQLTSNPLGGTPGYMSPEQAAALDATRAGRPLRQPVDARSDIYSLGVVLYECLTGEALGDHGPRYSLRKRNSAITPGIEDVIRRCLERDPARRYPSAAALAEDLRRHMLDLPLQGVANRSSWERLSKWRRRRPYAMWSAATLCALAVTLMISSIGLNHRLSAARDALRQTRELLRDGHYRSAAKTAEWGIDLIRYVPTSGRLHGELRGELHAVRRMQLLSQLHEVVEQLRLVDTLSEPPDEQLERALAGCASVWKVREALAEAAANVPDTRLREQFRRDFADLAILWSEASQRLNGRSSSIAAPAAVEVLNEVDRLIGPTRAVAIERDRHRRADPAGLAEVLAPYEPAWEFFVVGRALMREEHYERAYAALHEAILREPQVFWFHFHLARCCHRLERFEEALRELNVCIALEPRRPECYRDRAAVYQALGYPERARTDLAMLRELRAARSR